jgi:hypothetical protein
MKKTQDFTIPYTTAVKEKRNWIMWGYTAGGILCLTGLIILSVALGQALRTTLRGFLPISLPGANALTLKKAGLYIGVYQHTGTTAIPVRELSEMKISVSDTETGSFLPLQRGLGAQVFMAGGKSGAVLFQFEAPASGKYLLDAAYPSGTGPAVSAFLIHESLQNNRSDIAVGIILCVVFAGFGIYTLVRTRKLARRLEAALSPQLKSGKK